MRHTLLIFLMILMAACQPADSPLPTVVSIETQEVAPTIAPSPTITLTPRRTQSVSLGNAVNDPEQTGYLRVIHAAPDIPSVDVYVETTLFNPNLGSGQVTGKTPILAGSYTVKFMPRGASSDQVALAQTGI